jgi:hypothetical protein
MAKQRGEQTGRASHPLVGVATDGVGLGYQAVELVVEGMRESLRLQSGRGSAGTGGHPPSGLMMPLRDAGSGSGGSGSAGGGPAGPGGPAGRPGGSAPSGLVADVAAIIAELLTRAGAVAEEVAQTLTQQSTRSGGDGAAMHELSVDGTAGATAELEFSVWNTGATALRGVKLSATDLLGPARRIAAKLVAFSPAELPHVGPSSSVPVAVSIEVPSSAAPGTYRGLVQAEPGDTSAVIVLTVTAASKKSRGARAR